MSFFFYYVEQNGIVLHESLAFVKLREQRRKSGAAIVRFGSVHV